MPLLPGSPKTTSPGSELRTSDPLLKCFSNWNCESTPGRHDQTLPATPPGISWNATNLFAIGLKSQSLVLYPVSVSPDSDESMCWMILRHLPAAEPLRLQHVKARLAPRSIPASQPLKREEAPHI